MEYGKGATPVVLGSTVAMLPETGSNSMLFILAASLIVLGVGVMLTSVLAARKARVSE